MHPMQPIGINHVTAPNLSVDVLFDLAENLGAVGVELRDDLGHDIFDRRSPQDVGQEAQRRRLKILAIAPDIHPRRSNRCAGRVHGSHCARSGRSYGQSAHNCNALKMSQSGKINRVPART